MNMNMASSSTGGMEMASSTGTGAAAMATASGKSMGGMSMGGGSSCKISMLWNWYTVDACFLSSTWHITSHGMFAGSCIGVIILVMVLEFLRRASKEYDRYLVREHVRKASPPASITGSTSENGASKANGIVSSASLEQKFRPNVIQQAIRALLHMLQFAVAYFIMLLAMYYNGYIIICIFIGAYLGSFIFSWESMELGANKPEVTFCCG